MDKELPVFSGDPEDWPIFIGSFQQSTIAYIAAPKHDRLDTLIDFGISVENLGYHLVVADQRVHLSNLILHRELFLKKNFRVQCNGPRTKAVFRQPKDVRQLHDRFSDSSYQCYIRPSRSQQFVRSGQAEAKRLGIIPYARYQPFRKPN